MAGKIKKNWMKGLLMLCVMALAIGLFPTNSQAAPKLNKKKATIYVGKTVKLKVKGTKKKVKWSSTNKAVCKVSQKGLVTGKKKGTAYIKAKVNKKTLKCKITVKAAKKNNNSQPANVAPNKIAITAPSSVLAPGGTLQLSVKYYPTNAKKETVKWYSSNSGCASVENGLVKAKATGTTKITAELESNNSIAATYEITVKNITAEVKQLGSPDGGDIILSDSKAKAVASFTLSDAVTDVKVDVEDGIGNVVRTLSVGKVPVESEATSTWDLKNKSGNKVSAGSYRFVIKAAGASIQTDYFTVYARSEFGSGNGSSASPYPVGTLEQLELVANHNGAHFIQTADIDANLTEVAPLFSSDVPFTGTYDGGNYSIKNVSDIISGDETSIFRAVDKKGVVKNLTVEGSIFQGKHNVSALVGINYGTIENCKVSNCSVVASEGRSGLIAGWNEGTIKNCSTGGNTISATTATGGICGQSNGVISNCVIEDNDMVAKTIKFSPAYCGGAVGVNKGTIISCTATLSDITADGNPGYGGGMAGESSGAVVNCNVKECKISGSKRSGGIIGYNTGNNTNNVYSGTLNQVGN